MLQLRAIIQPIKLSAVQAALEEAGHETISVTDALGYGRQKGQTPLFRGNEYKIELLRKVIVEVLVNEMDLDEVVGIIRSAAKMGSQGEIGDGKIFVSPVNHMITW
ncbi:MAG: P-II family nitrogen regulator [Planctomycetota bacterium]